MERGGARKRAEAAPTGAAELSGFCDDDMSVNTQSAVRKIWGLDEESRATDMKQKVSKMYGENKYNPYLDKNGNLFNKYINYQRVLDNPNVTSKAKEFITKATGLVPAQQNAQDGNGLNYKAYIKESSVNQASGFSGDVDENSLASLDVAADLPKLGVNQISEIISKHFSNSPVVKPQDAEGIYNAQQKSGMSALAILGIGALESGYGTSNIAKQKNNIWGWNATNTNPGGNATAFSQMSQGAQEFADSFMKTYYNGYGAKSILSAGTGNNPSGKGYAYYDDGTINTGWAADVGNIMKNFYRTAKSAYPSQTRPVPSSRNKIVDSAKNYIGTPYVWGGDSISKGGMDCSGFVYNALKDAGYNIGRTTAQGYRGYGTKVSKSDLQAGDLVFFGNGNEASHVGIYIGNGQMIHSSGGSKNTKSNPGKGVSVANIDYRNDFIEARRY